MDMASSPPLIPDDDMLDEDNIYRDVDDLDEDAEEGDGIDLFDDRFDNELYANQNNQNYEGSDIDDEGDFGDIGMGARREIDRRLNRRDAEARRRIPDAFLPDDDEGGIGELIRGGRRQRHRYDEEQDDMDLDADIMAEELSLEALQDIKANTLTEWVAQPIVARSVAREFKAFLTEYVDEQGISIYGDRVKTLGEINAESLEVSFAHLTEVKATLAYWVANAPTELLKIFDQVAMDVVLYHYPDYQRIHSEVHVRMTDIPVGLTLRQLRQTHLNCLVRVSGVVTRRSGVFPQLKYVKFDCTKCGTTLGPFHQDSNVEVKISFCSECQSRGPFTVNSERTVYRNYQKLTLQESPGTVPAGRLPRHREIILLWDLIDSAKPGEEVEVTGVYRNNYDASLNNKNGFPVFATIIEANHIVKSHDQLAGFRLSESDEQQIRQLSKDPNIVEKVVNSIAPSIYGHTDIKTAVALSLFGGVSKEAAGGHAMRGDINVLLLGDPGTAKSQVLKYVEKTAHRAVFATGQGASAVGLTASVRRDPMTSEWTLEGGALVLADKGTCLIDEFDKMNDQDRTSIHEAMEQQTISISKAGIVTTLQARCAIVAAANPIGGRYNSTIPFSQNVELTEPILSRFDILCVVRDTVDPSEDERLAKFVVNSHARSQQHANAPYSTIERNNNETQDGMDVDAGAQETQGEKGDIPQELLRKYILYAREKCRPKLYQIDQDKVARLFADLRKESMATGAYPITVSYDPIPVSIVTNIFRSVTWKQSFVSLKRSARCVCPSTAQLKTSTVPLLLLSILSLAHKRLVRRSLLPELSRNTLSTDLVLFASRRELGDRLSELRLELRKW